MELMQVLRDRRSVRDYTTAPVSTAQVNRLVDAAIQAPSAVNAQPWMFTVIRDARLLDMISERAKEHMLRAIEVGAVHSGFREHLSDPSFHIFYHAPALILISSPRADEWAHEDVALAAENLMLAACAEGLGTCWIGFAQRWLESDEGRDCVDVPADYRPIAPIIVGHPKSKPPPVARKTPHIHWIG